MLLYWPKLLYPYYNLLYTLFPFLFFLSMGWYCGAGVFGLIGCIPLSLSLALPTFFNNNNNNNNNSMQHTAYYRAILRYYPSFAKQRNIVRSTLRIIVDLEVLSLLWNTRI